MRPVLSVRSSLILVTLFLLFAGSLQAQTAARTSANDPARQTARKLLESNAVELVRQSVQDAENFHSIDNQLLIEIAAINLLRDRDPQRAHDLLAALPGKFDDYSSQLGVRLGRGQSTLKQQMLHGIRQQIVSAMADYDPRMALDFLRSTRPSDMAGYLLRQESELELNLAQQVAASDAKLALELATSAMQKGLSYQVANLYSTLRSSNKEAAAKLAKSLVEKLKSEDLSTNANNQDLYIALNMLNSLDNEDGAESASRPLPANTGLAREIANTILSSALTARSNQNIFQVLPGYMSVLKKYAPSSAAELERKLSEQKSDAGQPDNIFEEFNMLSNTGKLPEMMVLAAKAPEEVRTNLLQQVARQVMSKNGIAYARQYLASNVPDDEQRNVLLQDLAEAEVYELAGHGELSLAHEKMASLEMTPVQRATMLLQLVNYANEKSDPALVLSYLEEADTLVGGQADNAETLGVQLNLSQALLARDRRHSAALLHSIVTRINELTPSAIALDGFTYNGVSFKEGELLMQNGNFLANIVRQISSQLGQMALEDFDQAAPLAEEFQLPEARTLARMRIAESVLGNTGPSQRSNVNGGLMMQIGGLYGRISY